MARKKLPSNPKPVEPDYDRIGRAIADGRELIAAGKTKVEASMAIFRLIEDHSQETIVDAFVKGAALTERGALTYWYNCCRKRAKEHHASKP